MNEVERIYEDLRRVGEIVASHGDVSSVSAYGEHSAKTLLLAGASYFERKITTAIQGCIDVSTRSEVVKHFAYHQAIERKFFSLFDFSAEAKNINGFLNKFGPTFGVWAKADMTSAGIGKDLQIAFLDFCRLRNFLTHNNYATYSIDKTLEEVKTAFDAAQKLVAWIESSFQRFEESNSPPPDV